jgi:hypothetical protein
MGSACCSGKCSLAGHGADAGSGWLLPAAILRAKWARSGALQQLITIHSDVVTTLMSYSILCNRLHTLDEQLCRWLLTVDAMRQSINGKNYGSKLWLQFAAKF